MSVAGRVVAAAVFAQAPRAEPPRFDLRTRRSQIGRRTAAPGGGRHAAAPVQRRSGWSRAGLTRRVAEGGLSDLRLVSSRDGRVVPYLLVYPPVDEPQWRRAVVSCRRGNRKDQRLRSRPALTTDNRCRATRGPAAPVSEARARSRPAAIASTGRWWSAKARCSTCPISSCSRRALSFAARHVSLRACHLGRPEQRSRPAPRGGLGAAGLRPRDARALAGAGATREDDRASRSARATT